MSTTSDCVICGAWIEIGDKRKTAKWKKEKKAIEDHATASDQGSFSALFLQVVNFILFLIFRYQMKMLPLNSIIFHHLQNYELEWKW